MIVRFKSLNTKKYMKYMLFLVWFFAVWTVKAQETNNTQIIEEAIRHQNLGLAYLEESQPSKAVVAFTALIELLPDESIGYGNLAVAHLRLQQADTAEEWVKRGIIVAPMDSQLHFILSEVYQLQGQSELAVEAMKEAVRLAPDELEFRYKLVRHYLAQRNNPEAQLEAVRHLQELHTRSPVNVVVLLKLTQGLLAQEKLEDAENLCQKLMLLLGDTEPEKLKYLTQGITALQQGDLKIATRNIRIFENVQRASPRYQQGIGELVTDILGHPIETFSRGFKARVTAKQNPPIDVTYVDVTEQLGLANVNTPTGTSAAMSLIDYDGDGNLDLYIASTGQLLRNTGEKFMPVQQFESDLSQHVVAFADLNKDGIQDFLLPPHDAITYLQMDANGNWKTSSLIQHEQTADETEVLFPVDFDHDGDLDLFSGRANTTMYRNNGDGGGDVTFTDVSEQTFVTTDVDNVPSVQRTPAEAVSADFDDDGDIDIFTTHKGMGCTLYDNLRQGKLRAVSNGIGIPQDVHYTAVAAGDYDSDGDTDLFLATADRIHLYRNRGDRSFVEAPSSETSVLESPPTLLKNVDYDNDGSVDVWVGGDKGMFLFRNDGTGTFHEPYSLIESITPAGNMILQNAIDGAVGDYDNDGDLDLFFINADGQLRALQNEGGNQNNWIQVRLEGITAGNNKVNRDGIGSKLEVKVGDLYQLQYVTEQVSHFGLGAYDAADVVRVVWTNGVPQNVVKPEVRQRILEKQVLKGSCPFLYVYDGEHYQFVTDLLWRAPLGLVTSMGFVAPDETKDFVKISGTQIQPKSGKYSIQITEELWETAYFDEVKLIAVDHPESTDIFVNEQYTPPPFAAFKVYGVSEKRYPKSAVDHRGKDVSDALKTFDYHYAVEHAPGPYQGVVEPHAIILDLGDVSNDTLLTLFLGGWIFPTDTSINLALFQNPAINPRFPSVAMKNEKGEWENVIDMIGLPAGKNKTITVDLTGKFLSEDRRVRIETDMQIYWDTAFFTVGKQTVPMEMTTLTPDSADLHYRGFSEMYRPNPHAPHLFDYQKVTKAAQWRDLAGFYTRYGDVAPLLQEVDDMYVILNAGDEITVEFDASRLPRLKVGWVRDFILYSDGWDKDGDINTLTSQTVEPLPFHRMSKYPYPETEHYPDDEVHRQYQREYNTRRVEHQLPPLDTRTTK
ncbi:hypothetical protein C6500_11560 [Candidatus Poribacteria bacterium]|nr:MAG: hypothetical protein C6500_11560 [Candidatus Poribacteria bacterium]